MALILLVVATVCFVASLLPFLLPGAAIALIGKILNGALADPLWVLVPPARGILVTSGADGPGLTLQGVLLLYAPLVLILLRLQRGR
jgi:hypothetical protein